MGNTLLKQNINIMFLVKLGKNVKDIILQQIYEEGTKGTSCTLCTTDLFAWVKRCQDRIEDITDDEKCSKMFKTMMT
jgi:hypothetical protein